MYYSNNISIFARRVGSIRSTKEAFCSKFARRVKAPHASAVYRTTISINLKLKNMKKINLMFWLVAALCVMNVFSSCKKDEEDDDELEDEEYEVPEENERRRDLNSKRENPPRRTRNSSIPGSGKKVFP